MSSPVTRRECWVLPCHEPRAWQDFTRRSGDWSFGGGVKWGFLLWLLLALPMHAIPNTWAGRDPMLTLIDGAEVLVALLVAGAIVGAWRPKGAKAAG